MLKSKLKTVRRMRRKTGIRKRIFGTPERPRLAVYRSNKNIYAQLVDDVAGKTLAASNSLKFDQGASMNAAKEVGRQLAEAARSQGVEQISFDRGGFRYHGRIKALADAAREAGLKF